PKMAAGKTLSYGGFTSPRVTEGQYKVVLKKGKQTFEHIIETAYDSNSLTTLDERKEQEALTQTMFTMVEDLAYIVYEIGRIQTKAKEVIDMGGKPAKQAQKTWNALEDLRTDLVVTTGDNYVASAEPELRERMGELYSNIATNYDRVDGSLKSNFELIRDEFDTEKARFQKIMSKEVKKFYKTLERNEMAMPVIKAKELFLAKD
ncbi:MAG: hypothetical protein P8O02_08730, partial [Ulvibacter sp.]|nr:hypothetical protein [Ulvibacter sp.]